VEYFSALEVFDVCTFVRMGVPTFKHATLKHGHLNAGQINTRTNKHRSDKHTDI